MSGSGAGLGARSVMAGAGVGTGREDEQQRKRGGGAKWQRFGLCAAHKNMEAAEKQSTYNANRRAAAWGVSNAEPGY